MPPVAPPAEDSRKRLVAIALIIGAYACFAGLDATAKWLTPHIGVLETTWARYVSSILFVTLLLNPWTRPGLTTTRRPWMQASRSLVLFASTALNFLALQYLQLTQTMTIMFLQPLLVALIAGPLLGEWVGPRRLAAIGVGFLGVVLVTRPGAGGIHWAAIFSFLGVGCYVAYSLMTRLLARHDSSETTMFYSGLAGIIILTPVMPFTWHAEPTALTLALMLAMGFWGALGHWLLILAHRHAPAGILAPFLYTQIIWMTALGYFVFGDLPDSWTLAGGAIVIASGIYLIHREQVQRRPRR
ncbi:DMT family transporter [Rhabdaerophilum calidifontis]|uniref:DMT family transporter n=1 Tax=Rhabdaerophilum calidifontis TaxID=2604328 RepID=UPI00123AEEC3|nr:DMT family transporter [Rhabdaerophilum calidifontis]